MSNIGSPLPREGWYDDPQTPEMLRYWNGSQWDDQRKPKVAPPPPPPPPTPVAEQAFPSGEPVDASPVTAAAAPPVPTRPRRSGGGNGFGTAALVIGIAGLLLSLIPFAGFVTWILALLAVIFGVVGLTRPARKRGTSTFGVILGVIAFFVGIGVTSSALAGLSTSSNDATSDQGANSGASAPAAAAPAKSVAPAKKATPAVSWYAKTYGTFAVKSAHGSGDDVVTLPKGAKAGLVIATYRGQDNFSVAGMDSNNQSSGDLLVNTIGSYSGTSAFGLETIGNSPTTLQVNASGPWTMTIEPLDDAKVLPASGTGDGIFKYNGGAATWDITDRSSDNFSVTEYSDSPMPNLMVNEIGNYSGHVLNDPGPAIIEVGADGTWTIQ